MPRAPLLAEVQPDFDDNGEKSESEQRVNHAAHAVS
jgi:hypothetical protein